MLYRHAHAICRPWAEPEQADVDQIKLLERETRDEMRKFQSPAFTAIPLPPISFEGVISLSAHPLQG